MKVQKELRYPKFLRVIVWIAFAEMFFGFVGSFISIFNSDFAKTTNSTKDSAIGCAIAFFILCLFIILLEFHLYRKKIIAGSDLLKIQYTFKKTIIISYIDLGQCVFIDTGFRGQAELTLYDINHKKLITMSSDLKMVSNFVDFLESKNVIISSLTNRKKT